MGVNLHQFSYGFKLVLLGVIISVKRFLVTQDGTVEMDSALPSTSLRPDSVSTQTANDQDKALHHLPCPPF